MCEITEIFHINFRVCGNNDQENFPTNLESLDNEISIFFRSSLKDSGRGLNCSYRVIEKELKPVKLYNGEGMYNLLKIKFNISKFINYFLCRKLWKIKYQ